MLFLQVLEVPLLDLHAEWEALPHLSGNMTPAPKTIRSVLDERLPPGAGHLAVLEGSRDERGTRQT